ncbi:hypothetical protein SESBI_09518 [Sesbania bispinosa]|nr:hypothetical protein SESBI_09518 [Sesbania bispinosa]
MGDDTYDVSWELAGVVLYETAHNRLIRVSPCHGLTCTDKALVSWANMYGQVSSSVIVPFVRPNGIILVRNGRDHLLSVAY